MLRVCWTGAASQFPLQQEIMSLSPFLMAQMCDLECELTEILSF